MTATTDTYRIVVDDAGRRYRIGESPHSLTGHSRSWMVYLPWIAMMGISVFEYGYGAAAKTLQQVHGWSLTQAFWIVTIWAVFQALIAFPALQRRGLLRGGHPRITRKLAHDHALLHNPPTGLPVTHRFRTVLLQHQPGAATCASVSAAGVLL